MLQKLKPLRLKDEFYADIERELQEYFYRLIYEPLYEDVKEEIGKDWLEVYNAKVNEDLQGHLLKRLVTGRIQYIDNRFYGDFDSKSTRAIKELGGKYDVRTKSFYLADKKLTDNIRIAIGTAYSKFEKTHNRIIKRLDELEAGIKRGDLFVFNPKQAISSSVSKMNKEMNKTLAPLTVSPEISGSLQDFIMEKYGNDLTKYIKDWNIQSIQRLRQRVSTNAFSGYRASSLVEEIIADYGVSQRKAKFLARQETSLILATFRQGRYKDAGIERYEWQTSNDQRVRDIHKQLNHKIFTWDNPPIIDEYGHRGNPGEAFGCRCIAVPIL